MKLRLVAVVAVMLFASACWAHDVIVIGAGAAGMAAAISARETGASEVLLIEKERIAGGHLLVASGSVNIAETPEEAELMEKQMIRFSGGTAREELVRTLAYGTGSAAKWLTDMGVLWDEGKFTPFGSTYSGARSANRRHGGLHFAEILSRRAKSSGVQVLFATRAEKLVLCADGSVCGVTAMTRQGELAEYHARAVILATGGFTANIPMRMTYDSRLDGHVATTADPHRLGLYAAMGDGIRMAGEIGAELVDMEAIGMTPLSGGRVVDNVGSDIFVNARGKRCVNEGAGQEEVCSTIFEQPDRFVWVITDNQSKKAASLEPKLVSGDVKRADSIDEMAREMNIPAAVLEKTLARYNGFVRLGVDGDFGKKPLLQEITQPPFYYGKTSPDLHYTAGGVLINSRAQVLRPDGTPVTGLYAAGEVTGGVHGKSRMGGNSIIDCIVFGRIAGTEAARMLNRGRSQ